MLPICLKFGEKEEEDRGEDNNLSMNYEGGLTETASEAKKVYQQQIEDQEIKTQMKTRMQNWKPFEVR